MFFKWAEPTNRRNYATLSYIKGITRPLTRILKNHDIQVTNKPKKTLQQHFPVPKFPPAEDDRYVTSFITLRVHLAPGATLEKQKHPLPLGKKNI